MEAELKTWLKRLNAIRDVVCDAEVGSLDDFSGDSLMQLRSRCLRIIRDLKELCEERTREGRREIP